MQIKITNEESNVAGFISWGRLAKELFRHGAEIGPHEHVVSFNISELGINYFTKALPISHTLPNGVRTPE